jgi:hypothetical protein
MSPLGVQAFLAFLGTVGGGVLGFYLAGKARVYEKVNT